MEAVAYDQSDPPREVDTQSTDQTIRVAIRKSTLTPVFVDGTRILTPPGPGQTSMDENAHDGPSGKIRRPPIDIQMPFRAPPGHLVGVRLVTISLSKMIVMQGFRDLY